MTKLQNAANPLFKKPQHFTLLPDADNVQLLCLPFDVADPEKSVDDCLKKLR